MRDMTYLQAAEPLLRHCHELLTDASYWAAEGKDAVLQHRLDTLAKAIKAELKDVRVHIRRARRANHSL